MFCLLPFPFSTQKAASPLAIVGPVLGREFVYQLAERGLLDSLALRSHQGSPQAPKRNSCRKQVEFLGCVE